jgi:hypothetical protein
MEVREWPPDKLVNHSDISPNSILGGSIRREDYMIRDWLSIFNPGEAINKDSQSIRLKGFAGNGCVFLLRWLFFSSLPMLTVISPARTLDYETPALTCEFTQPAHLRQSRK